MYVSGRPSQREQNREFIISNLGRLTKREMARRLGIHPATLREWLRSFGIPLDETKRLRANADFIHENIGKMQAKEIARIVGVSYQTMSEWKKSLGIPDLRQKVDPVELAGYFRQNAQTKTRAQMAAELNVHTMTVSRCLKKLGISTLKRNSGASKQGEVL